VAGRTDAFADALPGVVSGARPRRERASSAHGRSRARAVSAAIRARACLAVVLGAAIMALAVPRGMAAFWLWLRAPAMDRVTYGDPMSASDLYGLIASRELALRWVDSSEPYSDLASALMVLASLEEPESDKERALLERAIDAAEAGLARAPADPRGWTRLAYLRTLLGSAPDRQAAQALALSLRSGRYDEPEFLAQRLHLILLHWPMMPAPARASLADQIRLVWQGAPEELTGLALEPGLPDTVIAALADAPVLRSQLLDAMRGVIQAK
jgi:hypothetical protein